MSTYIVRKIKVCQIYPISKFTTIMSRKGFGSWWVDNGDTEVPMARKYYEKLCNVKTWAELEQILCTNSDISGASKMDLKKRRELYIRAVKLVAKIEGSVARAL